MLFFGLRYHHSRYLELLTCDFSVHLKFCHINTHIMTKQVQSIATLKLLVWVMVSFSEKLFSWNFHAWTNWSFYVWNYTWNNRKEITFYRGKEHPALNLFAKVFGKILIWISLLNNRSFFSLQEHTFGWRFTIYFLMSSEKKLKIYLWWPSNVLSWCAYHY